MSFWVSAHPICGATEWLHFVFFPIQFLVSEDLSDPSHDTMNSTYLQLLLSTIENLKECDLFIIDKITKKEKLVKN